MNDTETFWSQDFMYNVLKLILGFWELVSFLLLSDTYKVKGGILRERERLLHIKMLSKNYILHFKMNISNVLFLPLQ